MPRGHADCDGAIRAQQTPMTLAWFEMKEAAN
jgi:hypothetical protein